MEEEKEGSQKEQAKQSASKVQVRLVKWGTALANIVQLYAAKQNIF